MKIDRLELKAFGCFTGASLDFRGPPLGAFLIFGLNEAGKSTALDGIRQWLYGIDRNTPLDFKHKKPKQRVGGVISAGEQSLCCFRKRGNADTLLDDHDRPIGDDALRPLLQGIDENRFRTIFGINHFRLREGGRDIADGKGDLGQALFTAGSGLLSLNRMQKRLEEAKSGLFSVHGEKPKINGCLSLCREITGRATGERLTLAEFEQSAKALTDLARQRDDLRRGLEELSRKREGVDRLIRIIPLVRRREGLLGRQKALQGVVRLRDDFRAEFKQLDGELLIEGAALRGLKERLKEAEAELGSIEADPDILCEKDALLRLSKRAAQYETDYADRGPLITEKNQIQGEAKQVLRKLGREPKLDPELIEPLRLDNQKRNRVRELGSLRAGHLTHVGTARRRALDLEGSLRDLEEELKTAAAPPDTEGLSATLNRVTRMGELEKDGARLAQELARCGRVLGEEHSRVVLWSGGLDEIAGAPIPSAADIEYHRGVIEAAEKKQEDAQRRCRQEGDRLIDVGQQLERLHHAGDVPSEQDLHAERSRRERGWRLIRSAWRDGEPNEAAEKEWLAVAPETSLAEAYEAVVALADQTADRLRWEAQRVSEHAGLLAGQSSGQERLQTAEDELEQARAASAKAEAGWKAIWKPAGIEPRSPKEMCAWLDQWQRLLQGARDRHEAFTRWESKKRELEGAVEAVRSALETSGGLPAGLRPGASLGELTEVASTRIEEAGKERLRRTNVVADMNRTRGQGQKAKGEEEEAERAYRVWEEEWDAAIHFLDRPQRLSPDEANRDLDDVTEFWKKISDLKNRQSRIEGIEKRSGAFPHEVSELAGRLEGARLESEDPLRTFERHWDRLQGAEKAEESRREKGQGCEQLRETMSGKEDGLKVLRQRLQRLCQEAGVDESDGLPEAIRRSDEWRDVEAKLTECESDMHIQGGMADPETLGRLVKESEEKGRDCEQEKRALDEQLKEDGKSLEQVNRQIGGAEEALKVLRARSGTGISAAELESEYARLRHLSEEYVALTLASRVLTEAVGRYRKGNSSGLLSEASDVFRLLTGLSFDRLAISEDDDGKAFLVGVRPDGSEVGVDGMSDGTCDQLYLALRLAHLKRHAAKDGSFPFIVDDILLTFDDSRARAALHCLADLGQSMQVLYFTHHRHIRDMAAEAEFTGRIGIRDLP